MRSILNNKNAPITNNPHLLVRNPSPATISRLRKVVELFEADLSEVRVHGKEENRASLGAHPYQAVQDCWSGHQEEAAHLAHEAWHTIQQRNIDPSNFGLLLDDLLVRCQQNIHFNSALIEQLMDLKCQLTAGDLGLTPHYLNKLKDEERRNKIAEKITEELSEKHSEGAEDLLKVILRVIKN